MIQLLPNHLIADEVHQRLVLEARTRERRERRERIATAVLPGLLSDGRNGSFEQFAEYSVKLADALIAELDKQP